MDCSHILLWYIKYSSYKHYVLDLVADITNNDVVVGQVGELANEFLACDLKLTDYIW